MTGDDETSEDDKFDEVAIGMIDAIKMSWIGDGTLSIDGKTAQEVEDDFVQLLRQMLADGDMFPVSIDHRPKLLKHALRAEHEEDLTLAILLKATWVEHWVNGMIDWVAARKGVSPETTSVLVREMRLRSKLTAVWELFDLPEVPDDHLAAVDELAKHRNHFVHYKWQPRGDDSNSIVINALRRADAAIQYFQELEEEVLYQGRSAEFSALAQRSSTDVPVPSTEPPYQ